MRKAGLRLWLVICILVSILLAIAGFWVWLLFGFIPFEKRLTKYINHLFDKLEW
jgi:hypothetical protein